MVSDKRGDAAAARAAADQRRYECGMRVDARSADVAASCFAPRDGGLAQLFDGFEDGDAGLLAEDFAEQHAERANVAA